MVSTRLRLEIRGVQLFGLGGSFLLALILITKARGYPQPFFFGLVPKSLNINTKLFPVPFLTVHGSSTAITTKPQEFT